MTTPAPTQMLEREDEPLRSKPRSLRQKLGVGCCVLSMFMVGCTRFTAPSPTAPMAERVNAYQRYRPQAMISETRGDRLVARLSNREPDRYGLKLANGVRVYDPRRLLNLVDEDSTTAKHAREYGKYRGKSSIAYGIGGAMLAGGAALALGGIGSQTTSADTFSKIGIGSIIGAVVPFFVGWVILRNGRNYAHDAFRSYDRDLRAHLKIRENPDYHQFDFR